MPGASARRCSPRTPVTAELVEFLLEQGADPNAAGAGFTALHAAIMRRDEKMVRRLLAHGADANAPLRTWTPTRRRRRTTTSRPELVGATPFWLAARFNEPGVMRLLLKHGADPRFVHHVRLHSGRQGRSLEHRTEVTTALMAAAGMGGGTAWVQPDRGEREALMLEAVKLAVELGVDVNAANTDGRTALDAAQALEVRDRRQVSRRERRQTRRQEGTSEPSTRAVRTRFE